MMTHFNLRGKQSRPTRIPQDEMWLWDSPDALADVLFGLEEAANGEVTYIGSFADDPPNLLG